jgi:hypothetical protein
MAASKKQIKSSPKYELKFGKFSLSKPSMDNTMDNLIAKLAEQYINKSRRFQQEKSLFWLFLTVIL